MNVRKRDILSLSLWALLEKWGNKVFGLLTFVVLARLLDADSFGVIAIVRLLLDYLELYVAQGLGYAIIQKKELSSKDIDSAFWVNLLISMVIAGGVFVNSTEIAIILGYPEISELISWMSVTLVISGLTRIQVSLLTRDMRFKELALRGGAISVGGGCVGLIMAFQEYGVWSLVGQQLGGAIIGVIVLWFSSNWRPSFCISLKSLKELYSFSFKIIIDQQVFFVSQRIDEALIAWSLGANALGYYSIAKKLFVLILDLFLSVVSKIAFTVMSKHQKDKVLLKKGLMQSTKMISIVLIPIFLGSALLAPEVIEIAFGVKWLSATDAFSVLIVSGVFLIIPNLTHSFFNAIGKPELSLRLNFLRAVVSLILIFYGSQWGVIGVVYAILLRNIIGALADCILLQRHYLISGVQYFLIIIRAFLVFLPTGIVVYWVSLFLRGTYDVYIVTACSSSIAIIFYLASIFLLHKKLFNEMLMFLKINKATN